MSYTEELERRCEELQQKLTVLESAITHLDPWIPKWTDVPNAAIMRSCCTLANGYIVYAEISSLSQWDMSTPENDRKTMITYTVKVNQNPNAFPGDATNHYNNYRSLDDAKKAAVEYIEQFL